MSRGGTLIKDGILLRFETFSEIKSALEALLSPSAASVIMYHVAKEYGIYLCERIMEKSKRKEEVLKRLSELKNEENWGKVFFQDMDIKKGSGRVLIENSFEAVIHKTGQPSCHFLRGFLAGFLSTLLEKSITVVEEKCAAKGDKRCEFRFADSLVLYAEQAKRLVKNIVREASLKCSSENACLSCCD